MTGERPDGQPGDRQDATREGRLRAWLADRAPGETPASLFRTIEQLRGVGAPVPTERVRPTGPTARRAQPGKLLSLVAAAVVTLAIIGTGYLVLAALPQGPAAPPSVSPSGAPGSPPASSSAPGLQGISIGSPVLLGQQPSVSAALTNTSKGPMVSVALEDGSSCPASPVGLVGTDTVKWIGSTQSILYMAGDASAPAPVRIGFTPDCAHMTVTDTGGTTFAAPNGIEVGVWYLGMKPGDPTTVAAWAPASGQLAQKGGFLFWSNDGGSTWSSQADPAIPAGWDAAGTFWSVAPGRLVASRGPGFSFTDPGVPIDLTWDPGAGQVPYVMATGAYRDRVLVAVRDAAFESVATDGSGTTRLSIAAWRVSAGSRFVAVEGLDIASGAPTLAVSIDGVHFTTAPLPAEFASAPTDSVQLLALDDRVLLTDRPTASAAAGQLIHVWSVPVTGAPAPPPSPTPLSTPVIPSPPPAQETSVWTATTLPGVPSAGIGTGLNRGVSALPGGGFIEFVPQGAAGTLVYTSPDGLRWTQVGAVTGSDALNITGPVASNGHVYVALGTESGALGNYAMQQNGAAWVSTDLRTWTKAPVQDAFGGVGWTSIAAGPDGFVATGFSKVEGGSPAWFSADGLHWTGIADDRPSPSDTVEATGVSYANGTFVMVGRLKSDAAAWTSPDGRHWTIHAPLPSGVNVVLNGLTTTSTGFLALGSGDQQVEISPGAFASPVTPWISANGTTWKAGASSPALFGVDVASLVTVPGGVVATGEVGTQIGLWTARDGLDWVPAAGIDLTDMTASWLASDGRHALLVGSGPNGMVAFVTSGVTR